MHPATPPRILVVDNDPEFAQLVVLALEKEVGPAVACADTYRALSRLREEHFDVLVVELALPGASGFELLERLDPPVPAVVVTALFSPPVAARARTAGASAVLGKPFDPRRLVGAVKAAAASPEARDQAEYARS